MTTQAKKLQFLLKMRLVLKFRKCPTPEKPAECFFGVYHTFGPDLLQN